jgi:AcrR family transcriptional regulator
MADGTEAICTENLDPRIRRTRLALQHALRKLMEAKEFDAISVQEIAEAAGVNRATVYDHYTDKFALLECMVGTRFGDLLAARGIRFDGGCSSALKGIVTGVCDYLATAPGAECTRQLPHMEAAVIAVVRTMLLEGMRKHPREDGVAPEMVAGTLAWAIYGAAKEWVRTPGRVPVEEAVDSILRLVGPMFAAATASETTKKAEAPQRASEWIG